MRARVTVYPREEVLDPQGKAVRQALERIGFETVEDVRVGRSFDIQLNVDSPEEANDLLHRMCKKLLCNEVVESYEFELAASERAEPELAEADA